MSGMYNLIFGMNENAYYLLKCLGLTREDCGRFRDCYIHNGQIVIYTRNGGGNRSEYRYVFNKLSKHPNYICDEDDEFDYTYAYIKFSFPELYKDELLKISESIDVSEKWEKYLGVKNENKN